MMFDLQCKKFTGIAFIVTAFLAGGLYIVRQLLTGIPADIYYLTGFTLTIASLFGYFILVLNRRIIKPIQQIANSTSNMATGLYETDFPEAGVAEIQNLVSSLKFLKSNLLSNLENQEHESQALNDLLMKLQLSESRAKCIFNTVPNGLVLTDALGQIELVNPAMSEMAGYNENDMIGMNVDKLLPETHRKGHQQMIVDFVIDKNRSKRKFIPLELLKKDGGRIPIDLSVSKITNGNDHSLIAVIHDLTQHNEAERQIRIERDRAQSYLDTAEVAIISIDTEGCITLVNRKCCELLQYSEGELIGRDYFSLCPDYNVAEEMKEVYLSHVNDNDIFPKFFYINLKTKLGETRIFEWHNNTVKDYEWNTTGIILAGTDMTEFRRSIDDRKKLRERLFQSQKMQAIGQLSSGIAHDFNNLLASMMGYTELLQDMLSNHEDPSIQSYLHEVYTTGERARDIVEGILNYSRGAKSEEANYMQHLYIPGIRDELSGLLETVLPENIEIQLSLQHDLYAVIIDTVKLQQILINICRNAAESMPAGGQVLINTENLNHYKSICASCAQTFTDDYLCISITDTGCGIDNETMAHLFEPFYTTKVVGEVGHAAGMGLAVVHGLVHDANGHITVESIPNVGTTFKIMLPAASEQIHALEARG